MYGSEKLKKASVIILLVLIGYFGSAQVTGTEISHYLFPEFTKGVVLMKSGIRNDALLNFNSITEEMIFDTNGTKLALSQLELIDTVFIKGRKFIPFREKWLEVIYRSKIEFYAQHKCSIKDAGKPAGYGGTSQTSATTTYSAFLAGGRVYDMKLPEGYETKPSVNYWLKKDGEMYEFLSIRQLAKLFPEKSPLFKDYVKKHSVKYNNQESILGLLKYLESK